VHVILATLTLVSVIAALYVGFGGAYLLHTTARWGVMPLVALNVVLFGAQTIVDGQFHLYSRRTRRSVAARQSMVAELAQRVFCLLVAGDCGFMLGTAAALLESLLPGMSLRSGVLDWRTLVLALLLSLFATAAPPMVLRWAFRDPP
jgi:hypothetical protein